MFETATCHLQLGKQLHEAERFSRSDFLMLLSTETKSLEECLACLAHSKEGTQEAITRYRAQGAILESDANIRMLQQDSFVSAKALDNVNLAKKVKKTIRLLSGMYKNKVMTKTLNQLVKYLTCRKINLVKGLVMQAQRTVMRKRMKIMGSQKI